MRSIFRARERNRQTAAAASPIAHANGKAGHGLGFGACTAAAASLMAHEDGWAVPGVRDMGHEGATGGDAGNGGAQLRWTCHCAGRAHC